MLSKSNFKKSWEITNNAATLYRLSADNASVMMDSYINTASAANTADYEHKLVDILPRLKTMGFLAQT